jgi:hypothetical protein
LGCAKQVLIFAAKFAIQKQLLASPTSNNPDIFYEAVCAAGDWRIDGAWPFVAAIIIDGERKKDLLLTAIEAAVQIRPPEAAEIVGPLLDSKDDDMVDVVYEALSMADALWDMDENEDVPVLH